MSTFGSVSELSSTMPGAVGRRPHIDVGHDRLHQRRAEGETGLRIEVADLGDHVGEILLVDAAQPAQGGEIALGQKIEMLDQRAHRGIETVAILELEGEAFGEIARAHAGRIERLQDREHGLDVGQRGAELLGDGVEIAGEIAGLVDHIDQVLPDHAAGRIGDRQRDLFGEVVRQA